METSSLRCRSQLTFYIHLLTCQRNGLRPVLCSSPSLGDGNNGRMIGYSRPELRITGDLMVPGELGCRSSLWEQGAHPRANLLASFLARCDC